MDADGPGAMFGEKRLQAPVFLRLSFFWSLLYLWLYLPDYLCTLHFWSESPLNYHLSVGRAASEGRLRKAAQERVSHINQLTSTGQIYRLSPASPFTSTVPECWLLTKKQHLHHP